jgi:hypothetical protein
LCLWTFPGWHEEEDASGSEREVKPFPSRPVSYIALSFCVAASLVSFVAILWQHIVSSAAGIMGEGLSYGSISAHVGTVAMVLGWGGFFVNTIVAIGLLVMILSIRVLAETFG